MGNDLLSKEGSVFMGCLDERKSRHLIFLETRRAGWKPALGGWAPQDHTPSSCKLRYGTESFLS
jgi:hypothetical protein